MRMLSYVFETSLAFSEPVTDHSFVLRCLPKSTNTQKVMESQVFTRPRIPLSEQIDGFGNRIVVGYCPSAHESFDFYATGLAMVEPDDAGPTPAHPMFLQATKLTMPSDALRALAKEESQAAGWSAKGNAERYAASIAEDSLGAEATWARENVSRETSGTPDEDVAAKAPDEEVAAETSARDDLAGLPGKDVIEGSLVEVGAAPVSPEDVAADAGYASTWALAQRLCTRVFDSFEYAPGATDTTTTAAEAYEAGRGVCQDYAHVLIALCRALGIPARYVTGLMVGEGATHAWVEVHDGERWRGLDPTHNCVVDDRYMLFATGRDFEDCPIERGMFRGKAEQTQKVSASLGDDAPAVNATTAHLAEAVAAEAKAG
ncbi:MULTISPECIES: transglutaminase family protein [unclassified Adlercreutzia]|uniref:transglutaminase family protein n=1 Tax=unclassified Adlercreutzia TaxID=2636013 RepID=UPI0013ED5701|nr:MULTISPECIES: transglutaminase family protein [unclassified Adlercreutzia]